MSPLRLIILLAVFGTACSRPPQQADSSSPRDSLHKILIAEAAKAPSTAPDNDFTESNLPQWAFADLRDSGYLQGYRLYLGINPFFQAGLFDGDSLVDVAVQLLEVSSGKRGLAFVHRASHSIHVVGAGKAFGNGGDDFSWLWQWFVQDASTVPEPGVMGRQTLYVGKGDSAGGMIWWNGREYVWTQWGD